MNFPDQGRSDWQSDRLVKLARPALAPSRETCSSGDMDQLNALIEGKIVGTLLRSSGLWQLLTFVLGLQGPAPR